VGKKKGRSGKEGVRRGEGICAIGFREDGRTCAETQINRQEDHFHCTSLYPGYQKWGTIFIVPPVPPGLKSGGDNVGCAAHDNDVSVTSPRRRQLTQTCCRRVRRHFDVGPTSLCLLDGVR